MPYIISMSLKDRQVLEKAAAGDQKAIKEIWLIWSPKLTVYLRNCPSLSQEDREDLLQDIMGKLYQSLGSYKSFYSPATWIYTLAGRVVIDWRRKNGRYLTVIKESQMSGGEYFLNDYAGNYPDPERAALERETLSSIQKFIISQSPCDRQILFLVFYEGLSGRGAAKIMKLAPETVRDRLRKLKKQLKEEMNE
jgi:RNA polymerase sigma-70 factor (ECF subfamily)